MTEPQQNPFAVAQKQDHGLAVATTRAAQEVQAAMVIAKRFPRNQHAAFQRIIEACKRRGLAEEASYVFPRGGASVTGASIRLLEVVFQCWGNCQAGVVELEQAEGESRVLAFAWDLETNAYDSKTFTVRHERHKKGGAVEVLTDPRDQYELVANYAARRKRACMEAVIPRDIIDAALDQCEQTLKNSGNNESLEDRIRKMVTAFAGAGITVQMIEKRLGHKLDAIIEQELVNLRKIFTSIKDGAATREQFFDLNAPTVAPVASPVPTATDEQEEAAAGLAPQTPVERVRQPAQRRVKSTPAPVPDGGVQGGAVPTGVHNPGPAGSTPAPATIAPLDPKDPTQSHIVLMQLTKGMLDADVTEAEVMAFCQETDWATRAQTELRQLATKKLVGLCERWPEIVSSIMETRGTAN